MNNALRLEAAGVAVRLHKNNFTAALLSAAVVRILVDEKEAFRRESNRLCKIAAIASRRKHLAADLLEEHLNDWDGRFEHQLLNYEGCKDLQNSKNYASLDHKDAEIYPRGKMVRPMHLQTADVRMSWLRLNNVDVGLLFCVLMGILGALIYMIYRVSNL
jgi:hypothetical protein